MKDGVKTVREEPLRRYVRVKGRTTNEYTYLCPFINDFLRVIRGWSNAGESGSSESRLQTASSTLGLGVAWGLGVGSLCQLNSLDSSHRFMRNKYVKR